MKLLTFLVCFISISQVYAQKLDEKTLLEMLRTQSPQWRLVEAQELNALDALSSFDEHFETQLEGNYYYSKTNEVQFSQFAPVTTPVKNKSVGLSRATTLGMNWKLVGSQDQFSNSFVQQGTTTALTASASIDLYKDFFGRKSRHQESLLEKGHKVASYKKEAELKLLETNLRKVYWALVANDLSLKITNELLESSKKQVVEAQKRFSNNIADEGEVARYRSQVAARQAQIISLQYQQESLKKTIRDFIPELSDKNFIIGGVNVDRAVEEVLQCTMTISTLKEAPLDFTPYDEIAKLYREQMEHKQRINNAHSGLDVKLLSEYKWTGKGLGTDASMDQFQDNKKTGYAVGFGVSIPLEGKKSSTEDVRKAVDERIFLAQADQNAAQVNSVHQQVIRSIQLLGQVMKNQEENTKQLEISLKTSRKKFNQARLTVQQLVQEQDLYLQSNLDEIQTKLNVIYTLLDYFAVFTQTPCSINRI